MVGTRSDVKAFNVNQGASAALIGPARSRIRQIVIFADGIPALNHFEKSRSIFLRAEKSD